MNNLAHQHDAFPAVLRTDFLAFFAKVFATLKPGDQLDPSWHQEAIAHVLDECGEGRIPQLLINIPPRSLKTLMVSVAWVAFVLGRKPQTRFLCVSYTDDLSEEFSRNCREVMRSDWYKAAFPGTQLSRETAHELLTTAGGYRKAVSMAGSLTGRGGDIIIVDDPMKPEDAYSELGRAATKRYFSQTLSSRFDNQSKLKFIIMMQRLHEDDLSGVVLAEGGWHQLKLPAIAPEDTVIPLGGGRYHRRRKGDLLQPSREPQHVLDRHLVRLGSAGFEAQYQQDPTPAGGNMIKRAWARRYDSLPPLAGGTYIQSWDTAMKGDPACDYSSCTTWLEQDGRYYLVDVFRGKLDFPDLRKKALELYARYRPVTILVEGKGSGHSLIQELKVGPHHLSVVEQTPTSDKLVRLAAVAPLFEAGNVYLPTEAPWLAEYEKEIFGFPGAKHDDQVDSTSQFLGWINDRRADFFHCEWVGGDLRTPGDAVTHYLSSRSSYLR